MLLIVSPRQGGGEEEGVGWAGAGEGGWQGEGGRRDGNLTRISFYFLGKYGNDEGNEWGGTMRARLWGGGGITCRKQDYP